MKLNGPRNALFKGLQPSTFTVLMVLAPLVGPAPLLCAGLTIFNGLRNSKARPGELVAIQGVGGSVTSAFSLRGAWAFKSRPLLADQKRKVSPGSLGHITTLITMLKIQLPHFKPWVAPD